MTNKQKRALLLEQLRAAQAIASSLDASLRESLDDAENNGAHTDANVCNQIAGAMLPIEAACDALRALATATDLMNRVRS